MRDPRSRSDGIPLTIVDTAGLRRRRTIRSKRSASSAQWAAVAKADLALVLRRRRGRRELSTETDAQSSASSLRRCRGSLCTTRSTSRVVRRVWIARAIEHRSSARRLARARSFTCFTCRQRPARASTCCKTGNSRARRCARGHARYVLARERHPRYALRARRPAVSDSRWRTSALQGAPRARPPKISQRAHGAVAITGEFTSDDLLGVIFSRFCIGK
jgi:tRNA modification GTPase